VFQDSSEEKNRRKNCKIQFLSWIFLSPDAHAVLMFLFLSALTYDMEKHCNIEIAAKVVQVSSNQNGTEFSYGVLDSFATGNLFFVGKFFMSMC
jgi:hypothetical protein